MFTTMSTESVAMGKPVIVSNTTSLPEVVSGKYVLVKPASPEGIATGVEMVYKKKYHSVSLKKFTPEKNIEGYLRVYIDLLKKDH